MAPTPRDPIPATYSTTEAADVLGVGRTKMYELVRSGIIPTLRFGRVLRVPKLQLADWIETESRRQMAELAGGAR